MTRILLPTPGALTATLPVGAILLYPADTLPFGCLSCDGAEIAQSQYPTLFALVGTRYGTASAGHFRLPDLRGRVALGAGQGDGLTNRTLGESSGAETHVLTEQELPQHTHLLQSFSTTGSSGSPAGQYPAASKLDSGSGLPVNTLYAPTANTTMHENAVTTTGLGLPHDNMQPFLVLHFIIKAV